MTTANENLDAAVAREQASNSTLNTDLLIAAKEGMAQTGTGLLGSCLALVGLTVGGAIGYWNVCASHAEKVAELNTPEFTVQRQRAEALVAHLRARLDEEVARLQALRAELAALRGRGR